MIKAIRLSVVLGLVAGANLAAQAALLPMTDVTLRKTPANSGARIVVLTPFDTVMMLAPGSLRAGFYHVVAKGDTGWVGQKYVQHIEGSAVAPIGANVVLNATIIDLDHPATSISPDWPKTDPNKTDMKNSDDPSEVCHFSGTPGATEDIVNTLKNRSDTPAEYHAVTWDALAHLPWPKEASTHREGNGGWTAAENAAIAPFEREAITATGFIAKIRVQAKNHESTNCGWGGELNTDWHIEFVGNFTNGKAQSETEAVVVETTPRLKRVHPDWAKLLNYEDPKSSTDSVRISGWLMLDPEHKAHLGHYRQTLWEIHPITRIEVFTGGKWVNLDVKP